MDRKPSEMSITTFSDDIPFKLNIISPLDRTETLVPTSNVSETSATGIIPLAYGEAFTRKYSGNGKCTNTHLDSAR